MQSMDGKIYCKLHVKQTMMETSSPSNDHEDNDKNYIQKVYDNTIYFVTGKFTMLANGTLEAV